MGFCDHGSFYSNWNWINGNVRIGELFKRTNGVNKMTLNEEAILEAKKQIGKGAIDILQKQSGLKFRVSFKEPSNCNQVLDLGVPFFDIYIIGEVEVNGQIINCFYFKI